MEIRVYLSKLSFTRDQLMFIKKICGANLKFSIINSYVYFTSNDKVVLMYFYRYGLRDGYFEFTEMNRKEFVECAEVDKYHITPEKLSDLKSKHQFNSICEVKAKAFYAYDGPLVNPFIVTKFAKRQDDEFHVFFKEFDHKVAVLVHNKTEAIYFMVMGMFVEASQGTRRKIDELDRSGNYLFIEGPDDES